MKDVSVIVIKQQKRGSVMPNCQSKDKAYGIVFQCQLLQGHGGDHVFSLTWFVGSEDIEE